ncbi:MAG: NADH-quinone oxidoreductase subunit N [candidate division FCPU426 bacterium]
MTAWLPLLPEFIIVACLGAVLLADLLLPRDRSRRVLAGVALAGTLLALVAVAALPDGSFGGVYAADGVARLVKILVLAALGLVVLSAWTWDQTWKRPMGEFWFLLLSAGLGMMVLASGQELITLYIGLELATVPMVLLTAYCPADRKSAEGGLKFLILAAVGSGVLLFGLSLLYAAAGATRLADLAQALVGRSLEPMVVIGLLCVLVGLGFKVALVPFHLWVPDAYEGAPTPVTAFLSVASKTAGFVLALRLLAGAFAALSREWGMVLAVLAAATMTLGNFAAIPQTNLKRLLAYSSVAQAGYLIMGLVAGDTLGLSALLYYLAAYLPTNLAAFAVVIAIEQASGSTDLAAYAGLAQRSPRLGLVLMLALLSLAGIPPLAGFTAKFYLFTAVFGQGYVWLVVLAVLNSALSLYYYLRVIRAVYIQPPERLPATGVAVAWPLALVLTATLIGILLLGVFPGLVVESARQAVQHLL